MHRYDMIFVIDAIGVMVVVYYVIILLSARIMALASFCFSSVIDVDGCPKSKHHFWEQ